MIFNRGKACLGCVIALLLYASALYSQSSDPTATAVEALRQQLASLQTQMADVQNQLNKLSAHTTDLQSSRNPSPQQSSEKEELTEELNKQAKHQTGEAVAAYETYSQDPQAAPRVDNSPLDPNFPGYFRLPGTNTLLKIGGYFKTDFVRDLRPAGDPERFIPSSIPVPTSGGGTNSTVSVRPTRLNLDFLIPVQDVGSVRFFVEGDLFGSSSTTPRMRHAYAQVKNFLIGQTFSNFQDPDSGPDQLDFQGPNAQVSLRNPQFRYTIPLAQKTTFRLALEKASSDIAFTTPEFKALPSNQSPDGTATLRHDMDRGHVQLSGLFRSVGAFLPNGVSDSVFAWGFNFTGSQKTFGKDTFVYQGVYGHGIERYLNDTSGLGIDAAVKSTQDPHLEAVPVVAAYGSYQHFWVDRVRSSVMYGFVQADNTNFQPGTVFHQSNYASANVIWNVVGSLHIGTEFLYGWVVKKDGSTGNVPRLMLSAKYNFVKAQTTAN
ncbi:MAG: DcaP family trimeric outer membrane transporter [Terriglobales bacterium]